MKPSSFWLLGLSLALPAGASAQGSLTPPGPPAPTMKSLQELWDKVDALEREVAAVRVSNAILQETATSQSYFLANVFQDQLPWAITKVSTDSASHTSLAFGPDGQPAIAYRVSGGALRFARFDGSAWTITTVDERAGLHSSLAFGPDGHPAIAYHAAGDLCFARFNGSTWTTEPVDEASTTGFFASLAFSPAGQPAIAYYDSSNGSLRYARIVGSFWVPTTVDDDGDTGRQGSLAFGPDGRPAIAYRDVTERLLRFARFDGSTWALSMVWGLVDEARSHDGRALVRDTSLAFGPDGQPAIAYLIGAGNIELFFRWFDGSRWIEHFVDSGFVREEREQVSLAFGPDGQPAMGYTLGGRVRFARLNGSNWTTTTVFSGTTGNNVSALAFGPDGHPAMCFNHQRDDGSLGSLYFARRYIPTP